MPSLVPHDLRGHLTRGGKAKVRHRTLAKAEQHAEKAGAGYGAYLCPLATCGGYHVGRGKAATRARDVPQ